MDKSAPKNNLVNPRKKEIAAPTVVYDPEDVSNVIDGWLKDMGVDEDELRPNAKVPSFSGSSAKEGSIMERMGIRQPGRGLGFDQSSSSISSVNMLDPLQRNLARSLQLQQRAAKRREQEEAQADSSSSEEEELRPAARVSASPSSSGKGKIKKVMRKGDQMMFYQGAHQTKAMKKLLKKQQAAQKNKTSSPAKAAT